MHNLAKGQLAGHRTIYGHCKGIDRRMEEEFQVRVKIAAK